MNPVPQLVCGLIALCAFALLAAPVAATPAVTSLHSFSALSSGMNSDGANPSYGLLTQGSDGDLYGANSNGGPNGNGTVFKISLAGTLTTIYSFSGGDGPVSGLVEGRDGDFYGATSNGGSSDDGTIYKITPSGVLTTLHVFTGADGQYPYNGLILGSDGNYYGATSGGGANGSGIVYMVTPAGMLTTLYTFSATDGNGYNSDGTVPQGTLLLGGDGDFYGTTDYGGSSGNGTVFKITSSGALTTLFDFAGLNGSHSYTGLIEGSDGNFYGTTNVGGANDTGTVYRVAGPGQATSAPVITGFSPASGLAGTTVTITGTNFTGAASVTFNGTAATTFTVVSATTITATVPNEATTGAIAVTTPEGTTASDMNFTILTQSIAALTFNAYTVFGGDALTGQVTLADSTVTSTVIALAPYGSDSVPASVTVPAGATSASFNVTTSVVPAKIGAQVRATLNGKTTGKGFTLLPPQIATLAISPGVVIGGTVTMAYLVLTVPAPTGGIVVNLTSSDLAAVSVPATVTVPAGAVTMMVPVTTYAVFAPEKVTIDSETTILIGASSMTVLP